MTKIKFVPKTPGGSLLVDLAASTEEKAWTNLLVVPVIMSDKTKENFIRRGYKVEQWGQK